MYNNFPYSSFNPGMLNSFQTPTSSGIGSLLGISKKAFNWDSFLNNAQRTLNVINQAMPIYNQVRPMFRNMGTIFKVIGELNSTSTGSVLPTIASSTVQSASTNALASTPQFFA